MNSIDKDSNSNIVVIDISELQELNITPNSYVLAHIIKNKDVESYKFFCDRMGEDTLVYYLFELYKKGLLKNNPEVEFNYLFDFNNLIVTFLDENKPITNKTSENNAEFYDMFYNIFPKGVINGGGLYVKSNKADVDKKLEKFLKENKTISKDVILKATKNYIDKYKKTNDFTYMKTCSYFIKKDNMSILLSECENIDNITSVNNRESNSNMESI